MNWIRKKKILQSFLAILMVFSMVHVPAYAQEDETNDVEEVVAQDPSDVTTESDEASANPQDEAEINTTVSEERYIGCLLIMIYRSLYRRTNRTTS